MDKFNYVLLTSIFLKQRYGEQMYRYNIPGGTLTFFYCCFCGEADGSRLSGKGTLESKLIVLKRFFTLVYSKNWI